MTETTDSLTGLANRYRPLLVLYPEIADGSRRADNHRSIRQRPASAPLLQDYPPPRHTPGPRPCPPPGPEG
jgi:hypothetical protein